MGTKRTWGDREGHRERWPGYADATKGIFSFRKYVFLNVRTDYNLNLRFLVKKQISIADLPWGHKHFSWGHKRSLFFVGIQEVSARRVRKELINHNLYLFAGKWCKIQEIYIFTFSKIYLHSSYYFTSSNCIFMQLQGIVFIQLQGNYILVNC